MQSGYKPLINLFSKLFEIRHILICQFPFIISHVEITYSNSQSHLIHSDDYNWVLVTKKSMEGMVEYKELEEGPWYTAINFLYTTSVNVDIIVTGYNSSLYVNGYVFNYGSQTYVSSEPLTPTHSTIIPLAGSTMVGTRTLLLFRYNMNVTIFPEVAKILPSTAGYFNPLTLKDWDGNLIYKEDEPVTPATPEPTPATPNPTPEQTQNYEGVTAGQVIGISFGTIVVLAIIIAIIAAVIWLIWKYLCHGGSSSKTDSAGADLI